MSCMLTLQLVTCERDHTSIWAPGASNAVRSKDLEAAHPHKPQLRLSLRNAASSKGPKGPREQGRDFRQGWLFSWRLSAIADKGCSILHLKHGSSCIPTTLQ